MFVILDLFKDELNVKSITNGPNIYCWGNQGNILLQLELTKFYCSMLAINKLVLEVFSVMVYLL